MINNFKEQFWNTASDKGLEYAVIQLKEHIPEKLYRYRKINDDSISELNTDTIWLSNANNFNDPYDSFIGKNFRDKLHEEYLDEMYQRCSYLFKWRDRVPSKPEFLMESNNHPDTKELSTNIRSKFLISCLSERNDSILMWSHYADSHKGFCLEYDFKNLPLNHDIRTKLYPVIYSNHIANPKVKDKIQIFFSKSIEWNYEKEWRIIKENKNNKNGENYSVPSPKAIYLGSKVDKSSQKVKKIIELAHKKNIIVYQMQIDCNEYKLNAIPFNKQL